MVNVIKPSFVSHTDDKGRATTIFSLDVSPDSKRVATAGLDQKIKIWNTDPILDEDVEENPSTKRLLSTLGAHTGNVLAVRWSPDGHYLASGSDDFMAIVWEKDDNAFGRKVFGQTEENVETWMPVRRLVGHESDVMALAWSDDGYYLATGGSDRLLLIWDAQSFSLIRKINYHEGMVKGIAFDPAGELLATQSDDQSVCIWRTGDWSLVAQLKEPFVDSPNASWFRRLSWSPEGTFLAVPNSINNGVFVAGILKRSEWGSITSLIGHDNVVDVAAFNPVSFLADPKKPAGGGNLCAALAIAARNCISVWLTSQIRPVVVFDTIVDRETLDLSWSKDGTTLYACSSEGRIAVMQFDLKELGHPAPPGATERFIESWQFRRPPRLMQGPSTSAAGVGSADRPNILTARKGGQSKAASTALLPIPPPGAPQNVTITKNGKRRIQPAFLGTGGIVAQPLSNATIAPAASSQAYAPVNVITDTSTPGGFPHQPMAMDVDHMDHRMQPQLMRPFGHPASPQVPMQMQSRTPLQGVGMPSWGAPQERPVQYAQAAARKRKATELDDPYEDIPYQLQPVRPGGRTLGGDREFQPYKGEPVEIRPAYIPQTLVHVPSQSMKLAVPAIPAYTTLKWDPEDEDAERLEVRNYASPQRPSEIAQVNAKDKVQWLDYLPSAIVNVTFGPHFSAASCENGSLHIYSPSGRHLLPVVSLDGASSFLDSSGYFLLAITSSGTMHVWDIKKRKCTFKGTSVYPVIAHTIPTANPPTIEAAKVRANGCPVIVLSTGTAMTFDAELDSWTELNSTWWSKGSEYWEGRTRTSTTSSGRGIVKIMESEANDFLMAQQGGDESMGPAEEQRLKDSIEGEEQKKLGNEDDWKLALSLGHLENRMAAAVALDSLQEYKLYLSLYAKKLAEEAFRAKAEELVKDLLGPVYHRPGREDLWQTHVLGVHKHSFLREVLSVWGKTKNFSKLASDTNETLKRMANDI